MIVYQIKDWPQHFENAKSRERDRCAFVCMPNKQDGMGLQRILSVTQGAAVFGIWCLILQKVSRQPRPRLGWLTDDGRPDGVPWDLGELAFQWRQSKDLIESAIAVFATARIGWMNAVLTSSPKSAGYPAGTLTTESTRLEPESTRLEAKSTLEGRKEGKKEGRKRVQDETTPPANCLPAQPGEDPFDDTPTQVDLNPKAHFPKLKALGMFVPRSDRDPEDDRETIAEVIRIHGIESIHSAAERIHHRKPGQWYLRDLQAEIDASTPQPAQRDDDIPEPAPECVAAVKLAKEIGFAKVQATCGFQAREGDMQFICQALSNNPPACVELLKANGVTW